jgi:hypothetical protein
MSKGHLGASHESYLEQYFIVLIESNSLDSVSLTVLGSFAGTVRVV